MNPTNDDTLLRFSKVKGSWFTDSVARLMDASKRYNPYVDISLELESEISEYYVARRKFFSLIQIISNLVDGSISLGAQDISLKLLPYDDCLGLEIMCTGASCSGENNECQELIKSLVEAIEGELEIERTEIGIGIVVKIPTVCQ